MKFLCAVILFCFAHFTGAQGFLQDSIIRIPMIFPQYGPDFPFADMKGRFGSNGTVGLSLWYKQKANFFLSIEGNYLFGNHVREDSILHKIMTKDSLLISQDGLLTEAKLFERGFIVPAVKAGKIFSILSANRNSGFFLSFGTGFIQHKIKITVIDEIVPSLTEEYKKGYYRLTNGWFISENFGYLFLGNNRVVNFIIYIQSVQAFTKNRRSLNYDTGEADTGARVDILTGLRAGWVLPLYKIPAEKYYYN